MKKLIYTLLLSMLSLTAVAEINGSWRMHPTFNLQATSMAETADYVYFASLPQTYDPEILSLATFENSLFRYDKDSDEIVPLSISDGLSSASIKSIVSNPSKDYIVVVYNDYDIDIITSDRQIHNIPAIRTAQIPGSKEINDINFYPQDNAIFVATDFGYVVIDDEKYEVRESRNYNRALSSAARLGDTMLIAYGGKGYSAPYSERRMNISEYQPLTVLPAADNFVDLGKDSKYILAIGTTADSKSVYALTKSGAGIALQKSATLGSNVGAYRAKTGVALPTAYAPVHFIFHDLQIKTFNRPTEDFKLPVSTWDNTDFYSVAAGKGLHRLKADFDKKSFTVTKEWSLPNAPNPYISRAMAYHPRYGLLVNNYGGDALFQNNSLNEKMTLSAYRHGMWTPMSAAYRNPQQAAVGANPMGLVVDIDDDRYIYTGSNFSGITRTNLDDPQDVLHMTHPTDATAKLPGYVKMHDDLAWSRLSTFTPPVFDANGVLWSGFLNWKGCKQFWYWTPENRRASKSAASFRPWGHIDVKDLPVSMNELMLPLVSPTNRGILIGASNGTGYPLVVYDHKNTLDNTSDDQYVIMTGITDQDGGTISLYNLNFLYEDPDSGTVWVCCPQGVFYFQPRNALNGQYILNRVKVARNDGTALADYLLNNIHVTHIATDAANRKWFSTNGAGIVVTSSDGRTVLQEFTTANSQLPSDAVLYACYYPENNSMMISTDKGLTEFVMHGGQTADGSHSLVRAFPNPVTPDYYGYVTIDGLPESALVKIVDSEGNLVRELGRAEGGSIQWDILNLYGKRVRTGVYFVLSSTSNGEANVAKILVMN